MLHSPSSERVDRATVALQRALDVRFETRLLQSKLVEKRIEQEHARALSKLRTAS